MFVGVGCVGACICVLESFGLNLGLRCWFPQQRFDVGTCFFLFEMCLLFLCFLPGFVLLCFVCWGGREVMCFSVVFLGELVSGVEP